jgi:hypothetical protein
LNVVSRSAWDRLAGMVERHDKLSVAPPLSLHDTAGGRLIRLTMAPPRQWVVARLGAATREAGSDPPWRWTYAFVEVEKTSEGYGGWTDMDGGRTGTAYNMVEDANPADGVLGNGVDTANLTGTFAPKPASAGVIVCMFIQTFTPTPGEPAVTEHWFGVENGIDGQCEEGSGGGGGGTTTYGGGTWT